jgi:hypothetical protein
MGEHSLEDRDPGNTPDVPERLAEDFPTDELGDILARLERGDGVAHTSPPAGWTGPVVVHPDDQAAADDGERHLWWEHPTAEGEAS